MSLLLDTVTVAPRKADTDSPRKLHIAWLCPFVPRLGWGGATRSHHLIRQAARQHDVDVLAVTDEEFSKEGVPAEVRRVHFFRPDFDEHTAKIESLKRGLPVMQLIRQSAELDSWLERHGHEYDAVVAEFTTMSWASFPAKAFKVLNMHNIEHELVLRTAKCSIGAKKLFRLQDGWKLRAAEKKAAARFDLVVTCSDRERDIVARWRGVKQVATVPNGVDTKEYMLPRTNPEAAGTDLLFVGTMNYFPNVQAVHFLKKNVMPRIWSERPETAVRIVGVNPTEDVLALTSERFRIVGGVPEVASWYQNAKVFIVPLLSGSGTRLKIVEAAAAGAPVVSTPVGAEGLNLKDGVEIVKAEQPEKFAEACLELLADPARRSAIAADAQSRIRREYEWESIGGKFVRRIAELASQEVRA